MLISCIRLKWSHSGYSLVNVVIFCFKSSDVVKAYSFFHFACLKDNNLMTSYLAFAYSNLYQLNGFFGDSPNSPIIDVDFENPG
jgi:hypothetical protein